MTKATVTAGAGVSGLSGDRPFLGRGHGTCPPVPDSARGLGQESLGSSEHRSTPGPLGPCTQDSVGLLTVLRCLWALPGRSTLEDGEEGQVGSSGLESLSEPSAL